MNAHVLVPYDGSEPSGWAVSYVKERLSDERITLLHVVEPFADHGEAAGLAGRRSERVYDEATQLLAEATADFEEYAGGVETELVYGRPEQVIPRYVETNDVDEVVIGAHGQDGAARLLLGGVAETVLRRAPVPVTVVRPVHGVDRFDSPEHVLVPFDGSVCSRSALEYAFDRFPTAAVAALYVHYPPIETFDVLETESDLIDAVGRIDEEHDSEGARMLSGAKRTADEYGRPLQTAVESGDPARVILSWIDDHDVDHVVMGCHGRTGLRRLVLGSVAETVARRAPVPVTAVP